MKTKCVAARLPVLALVFLTSCADLSVQKRLDKAQQAAAQKQWQMQEIAAAPFRLAAFMPIHIQPSRHITVYIEGDGLAWISSTTASLNPTPNNPVGLELALRHSGHAAYLARPCQYVLNDKHCRVSYWTNRRFAPEVVEATSRAVDVIKAKWGADTVELVGYSGGGAVAALVAARRTDVSRLITVAGNLDHVAWSRAQRITPLKGSLNAADEWHALASTPQIHFVGERDDNITAAIVHAYAMRFPARSPITVRLVPEQDHSCCWIPLWEDLLQEIENHNK